MRIASIFCPFVILTLLVLPRLTAGGQMNVDSLVAVIRAMPDDTTRVNEMNILISRIYYNDPMLCLQLAEDAAAWSRKLNYSFGEMKALSLKGYCYINMSDYEKAREQFLNSISIAEKTNHSEGMSISYGGMGNAYYFQSLFPEAIEWWLKGARIAENRRDTSKMVSMLSNVGSVYMDMGNDDQAMLFFRKAFMLNMAGKELRNRSEILGNMAIVYRRRKEYDKAGPLLFKALEVARQVQNEELVASSLASLVVYHRDKKQPEKALENARQSLYHSRRVGALDGEAFALLLVGQCLWDFADQKRTDWLEKEFNGNINKCLVTSLAYHDSALTIYETLGMPDRLKTVYDSKSSVQEALGDTEGALKSYKRAATLKDSLFSLDLDKKLAQTTIQYEFDKKQEADRVRQQQKDVRERNIRNSITGAFFGALIFGVVVFRQRNKINKARKRSDELLLNILPEEVAEELKAKGEAEAKQIDHVTVLFTDFKGFTALSETLSPKELVRDLNECFSAFDRIMQKYGIEKIKTIGDAYMAAGGLPVPNSTHAVDVVRAAIEIRDFVNEGKARKIAQQLPYFEIRIGIHTGPVVAGIVGVKKFAYDIWGDTVNTASRMESSGEVGKINVSETTWALIHDRFECTHRGEVQAKGKGMMNMYFVHREKP